MSGVQVTTWAGTSADVPVAKRAVGRLSDGRGVVVMINTNLAGQAFAGDQTNVAKFEVWLSSNSSQTSFTRVINYTPAAAPANNSIYGRFSIAIGSDNSLNLVYVGVEDDSLRFVRWPWTSSWGSPTAQTVIAGSYSSRFRVVDIDVAGADNIILAAYEASDETGAGAYLRTYVRLTDGTTWRRASTYTAFTSGGIKSHSDDICVSWRGDGIVSNVGRFLLVGTRSANNTDNGDLVREYSFNVSSGAADSATVQGTWTESRFRGNSPGYRKVLIFKVATATYLVTGVNGSTVPVFHAAKFVSDTYTMPVVRTIGQSSTDSTAQFFAVNWTGHSFRAAWTASYSDNVLVSTFMSTGYTNPRITREIVFTYASAADAEAETPKDIIPRPSDENYYLPDGPMGVYGGFNGRNTSGDKSYDFAILYGKAGDTLLSTSAGVSRFRYVSQDTYSAPTLVSPLGNTVGTNTPTFKVRIEQANSLPNTMGVVEVQLATDTTFTSNVVSVIQGPSAYQYFGSQDGVFNASKIVSVVAGTDAGLFTSQWYWRARVNSDKGRVGIWSSRGAFQILHPPTAVPLEPSPNENLLFTDGDVDFFWEFTDTNPTDTQSEYRVIIRRQSDGLLIHSSGFVASSLSMFTYNFDSFFIGIPMTWTIQVRDSDGILGAESPARVFILRDSAAIAITSPTDGAILGTGSPSVTWSFSASGGRIQKQYRVRIVNTATTATAADSGWRTGTNTTHNFVANVLENDSAYEITLQVMDSVGLVTTDSINITTDYVEPGLPNMSLTADAHKVIVQWDDFNKDLDFIEWRVYRRYMAVEIPELDIEDTANQWVLIATSSEDATSYTFNDYLVPLNIPVDYVVVQLAERSGSMLESNITSYETIILEGDRYFFVPKVPIGSIASFEGSSVNADGFQNEIESETLNIVGRGRQVQIGDNIGVSGTLGINLRNPANVRSERQFFEMVARQGTPLYIKSPFGDVILCNIKSPSVSRIPGVGPTDMVNMTIQYEQIYDDDKVIRSV